MAIDCNGLSSVTPSSNTWPVVLITAPVDKYIGGAVNPYAYTVEAVSTNFVRALVFDTASNTQVSYRIDGGTTWYPMTRVTADSPVWKGDWNASGLAAADHTIEVRAVSTATVSDSIKVQVVGTVANRAPVAVNDSYTTEVGTTLTVPADGVLDNDSDSDGDTLTPTLVAGPSQGTLTLSPDGSFTYTPNAGVTGQDTFTYTANDGKADSNVATVTISVTVPQTDTVTISSATYTKRRSQLSVQATSSAAPTAQLTVYVADGRSWPMSYTSKTKTYALTATTSPAPPSVTVRSTAGGSASKTVTVK
jgi:hypothetical protein